MNARQMAQVLTDKGLYPIPLHPRTKKLKDDDGLGRIYFPEDIDPGDNLGIQLVGDKKDRAVRAVAVDFDAPEITKDVVWSFLPTTAGWGRESKPVSQILYNSAVAKSVVRKDLGVPKDSKGTLIELRATHQSMCPPSIHPEGEKLTWLDENIVVQPIEPDVLRRDVDLIATYALVARHYPGEGSRNEWCLPLSGVLRKLGITEEEAKQILSLAAKYNSDGKKDDRLKELARTYAKEQDGDVSGFAKLAEATGKERGQLFVDSLREIWGSKANSQGFEANQAGQPYKSQANIRLAFEKLGVRLWTDTFAHEPRYEYEGRSDSINDTFVNRLWLTLDARFNFLPPRGLFESVLDEATDRVKVHPVCDYLDGLKWDGVPRINKWLVTYGHAVADPYVEAVGSLFLIAAVRRVRQPGCKFDELPILESPQGFNKSTALRMLVPRDEWFSDSLAVGADAKRTIEGTAGIWIMEASDLHGRSKHDITQLKASLSRQVDGPVRLAYGRRADKVPRQFVVIGTTNLTTYLTDSTGNRRFWPVKVERFDIEALRRDRDQLWAEAAHREAAGESIRLPESLWPVAEKHQDERRVEDPWEEVLAVLVEGLDKVSSDQVWSAIGVEKDRRSQADNERLGAVMRRLGFKRVLARFDGQAPQRAYERLKPCTTVGVANA